MNAYTIYLVFYLIHTDFAQLLRKERRGRKLSHYADEDRAFMKGMTGAKLVTDDVATIDIETEDISGKTSEAQSWDPFGTTADGQSYGLGITATTDTPAPPPPKKYSTSSGVGHKYATKWGFNNKKKKSRNNRNTGATVRTYKDPYCSVRAKNKQDFSLPSGKLESNSDSRKFCTRLKGSAFGSAFLKCKRDSVMVKIYQEAGCKGYGHPIELPEKFFTRSSCIPDPSAALLGRGNLWWKLAEDLDADEYPCGFTYAPNYQQCETSSRIMKDLYEYCPPIAEGCDSTDDQGMCPDGKRPHRPSTCGENAAPHCETWLNQNLGSRRKLKDIVAGLNECDTPEDMSTGHLMMWINQVALDCGYDSPYLEIKPNTCFGAFSRYLSLNHKCPQKCFGGEFGDCRHATDVCGAEAAPECETWLTESFGTVEQIQDVITGIGKCRGAMTKNANFHVLSQWDSAIWIMHLTSVFQGCGYASPYPPQPANTCFGAMTRFHSVGQLCPLKCFGGESGVSCRHAIDTCGAEVAPECKPWLTESFGTVEKIQDAITGFDKCEEGMYDDVKQWDNETWIMMLNSVYHNCGYASPYPLQPANTCAGAAARWYGRNEKCPMCTGICSGDGFRTRDVDSCGSVAAPECLPWLTDHYSTLDKLNTMLEGLATCEGGPYDDLKVFSDMGVDSLMVGVIYTECGYADPFATR